MLYAILQELKKEFPNAKLVMEKSGRAPIAKQRELGILTKFRFSRHKKLVDILEKVIPSALLNAGGYVKENQIQIVLDGSGFAFGDKWGANKAGSRLADHIVRWKTEGKKVILLPQAFGPFEDEKLRAKMKLIIDHASLVFARDKISYDHLLGLSATKTNIKQRPDFTNLIKGDVPAYFETSKNEVAIIPNSQMIAKVKDAGEKERYPSLLENVVELVREEGFAPFFLIHEGESDKAIADVVNKKIGQPIPVIVEDNPLKVKGIIGNSKAVITSRFHGLVSALSQATPCLTTGWSHKYEMLLEDYDYSEGMLYTDMATDELRSKIKYILEPFSSNAIKIKLEEKSLEQKNQTKVMWSEVVKMIAQ